MVTTSQNPRLLSQGIHKTAHDRNRHHDPYSLNKVGSGNKSRPKIILRIPNWRKMKVEEEARAKEKLDEKESSSAEHFAKDKAKGLEGEWTRMLAEALPTGDKATEPEPEPDEDISMGGTEDE